MREIEGKTTEEMLTQIYEKDKQSFDDFVASKKKTMDFSELKRLVLSELTLKKSIRPHKICGFTRQQIINMTTSPERYGKSILKLMDYMYQKSGYMKRLIDYFSNMALLNYHVDTEALNIGILKVKDTTLKNNYIKFCAQASKYNLSNSIHDILKKMFLNDACFAYVEETDLDVSYFFLDPRYCEISKVANGNMYKFAVNRSLLTNSYFSTLPQPLQELIESSYEVTQNNLVDIPYENSLCIKYNTHFLYLYPPFFSMIADILLIDEYKDLAKSQAVNDAYKLLVLKIPTKDGELTMDDAVTTPFISTALQVVQENIGVLPVPFDTESVEFSGSNADDRDKVEDATNWMYSNVGVSRSILDSSSSGSELNLSIINDGGDIFRIYRMLENWVALQQKLRGFIYSSYQFVYKIPNITIFNQKDVIDEELKLAQNGLPDKSKLCAVSGISPTALIGNSIMENVFRDIYDGWKPLSTSYTATNDNNEGGREQLDDKSLSESGEKTRENDTNNPDNRI